MSQALSQMSHYIKQKQIDEEKIQYTIPNSLKEEAEKAKQEFEKSVKQLIWAAKGFNELATAIAEDDQSFALEDKLRTELNLLSKEKVSKLVTKEAFQEAALREEISDFVIWYAENLDVEQELLNDPCFLAHMAELPSFEEVLQTYPDVVSSIDEEARKSLTSIKNWVGGFFKSLAKNEALQKHPHIAKIHQIWAGDEKDHELEGILDLKLEFQIAVYFAFEKIYTACQERNTQFFTTKLELYRAKKPSLSGTVVTTLTTFFTSLSSEEKLMKLQTNVLLRLCEWQLKETRYEGSIIFKKFLKSDASSPNGLYYGHMRREFLKQKGITEENVNQIRAARILQKFVVFTEGEMKLEVTQYIQTFSAPPALTRREYARIGTLK